MHHRTLAISTLCIAFSASCASARAADEPVTAQLQQNLDNYLAQYAQGEKITGIALQVSLGNGQPGIAVSSGNDGLAHPRPLTSGSLFQIGSNNKSFTAALILKLEAEGKLNIDQTIGDWLPQYPAWKSVTIRQLLNMTSGIPTYDETVDIGEKTLDIYYQFTPQQLIASVDPDEGSSIPPTTGWSYSNTNYILAGLIIEKASGISYKQALEKMILRPLDLRNTYYYDATPRYVLDRMPAGFFNDPTCLAYQPDAASPSCVSVRAPLIGKDMRAGNMSWGGPAGGIISDLGDLARWYRALFGGHVIPQVQLDEMKSLVSTATGHPLAVPCAEYPQGYGLGLLADYNLQYFGGLIWYYEGETFGYRVVFAYWPQYDLVVITAANSSLPADSVTFPKTILSSTLEALINTGTIGGH